MSLQIDEHRLYWTDANRVSALSRAIAAVVRPGDVVVDLGCGSGILGLFACRAGAAKVYSIDAGGMSVIARALAEANGYADRMQVVKGLSMQVTLPEAADVVIADQIGNFGFNAGVFEFYADAYRRLLKPGARSMPGSLHLAVAPWEEQELFDNVEVWGRGLYGMRTEPVLSYARNTGYQCRVGPEGQLGATILSPAFPLNPPPDGTLRFQGESTITRRGTLHGLTGWFLANLAPGITMTNDPSAPDKIERRQIFLPFGRSLVVEPGDVVQVDAVVQPVEVLLNARLRVLDARGVCRFDGRHSTFLGMLLPPEDMARRDHGFRPRLSRRGQARRFVVNAFDGEATVGEIARRLHGEFPDVTPTVDEAAIFVTEVSIPYGE